MKVLNRLRIIGLVISISVSSVALSASDKEQDSGLLRVYQVNKKVCDFPDKEDLSTPEAAYATIMRDYWATGASNAEWSKVSIWKSNDSKRKTVSSEAAQNRRNAHIVEVIIYKNRLAQVIAQMKDNGGIGYDQRRLFFHKGRWLNCGQDLLAPTLREARDSFARKCGRLYIKYKKRLGEAIESCWNRQPVANPEAHLKPFIRFLKENGENPKEFVMKELAKHKVSIIGEIHHRPGYWALNSSLVTDPEFPKHIGTIYMELPSHAQGLVDKFLGMEQYDPMPVIEMLRDNLWMGWPDQPMLNFFKAVWNTNHELPGEQRLRIILVDMERPWKKIRERAGWGAYDVERDKYMAENIVRDIQSHPDEKRNGLFIVGVGHTALNFAFPGGYPLKTAGWHLREKLGADAVYAIMQHRCVSTNMGRVDGRLCLGLFDSAFAKLGDEPIAFTLEQGPFGEQMYDGDPEEPVQNRFRDGFNAYLYLGPLETEIYSPLIEGFYTDEFVKELERRHCLMFGKGWAETYGIKESNADTFVNWMSGTGGSWGKPRKWRNMLGPENAWHYGDNWKTEIPKEHHVNVRREELTAELDKIYRGIREIGRKEYSWYAWENEYGFNYMTRSGWDGMYLWWCNVAKKHPLESVQYGELRRNKEELPQIEVTTMLQGGISFSRVFVFTYMPLEERWQAQYGLDLHLDEKWKDFPKTGKIPSS